MCPVCVLLWVASDGVLSWSALQFALQDLKIALANTSSVLSLFVLYCIVLYTTRVCVWVGGWVLEGHARVHPSIQVTRSSSVCLIGLIGFWTCDLAPRLYDVCCLALRACARARRACDAWFKQCACLMHVHFFA